MLFRSKNLLLSRPSRSAQREVVGRFRIGLGPQRVVPPLAGVVGKTLSLNRVTQQMPVATLRGGHVRRVGVRQFRSDTQPYELQSLINISDAVFCLKTKNHTFTTP